LAGLLLVFSAACARPFLARESQVNAASLRAFSWTVALITA
jgi:hypothetical protein